LQEIEIKLALPVASKQSVKSQLSELFGQPCEQLMLSNVYFDTDDCQLRKQRWAIRIRNPGNGQFEQTVKGQGSAVAGLHSRIEHNWHLDKPLLDSEKLAEIPDFPVALKSQLKEVFKTDFQRTLWLVRTRAGLVEVVCDEGTIKSSGVSAPIFEIELELKEGGIRDLFEIAERTVALVPCWLFTPSKAARGYAALAGEALESPDMGEMATLADWVDVAGQKVQIIVNSKDSQRQSSQQLKNVEIFTSLVDRFRTLVMESDGDSEHLQRLIQEGSALCKAVQLTGISSELTYSTWLGRAGVAILRLSLESRL